MAQLRREIGLRDLILFNIAAVTSMRWLAAAAHAGPVALALWVIAGVCFFIPSAICISALERKYPEQGGLYVWARESFGEWHGFLCGYSYILANLFYFASLSMAIASTLAALLGAQWSEGELLVWALAFLWVSTAVNVVGGRLNRWTGNIAAGGTCVAGGALVVLALTSLRNGVVLPPVPAFDTSTLNLWSQLAFAYVGLELSAILSGEIRDPARTVPRAAAVSGVLVATFYILGTYAILTLVESRAVSPVTGLVQTFEAAGLRYSIPFAGMMLSGCVVLAMAGQLGAWVGGNARLPFVIGVDRYLPPFLAVLHPRWGTPWLSLISQSGVATVLGIAMVAGETVRAGYQMLVDVTVLLTFLPFGYIFLAAWKLGQRVAAGSGMIVTVAAMALSMVAPEGVTSVAWFELKVVGGCALLIGAGRLNFRYARWVREAK